jgi:DNA polymerase III gamma/tau subunit
MYVITKKGRKGINQMVKRQRGLIEESPGSEETEETITKETNKLTLPLHTKCRPASFDDFIGNTSAVNSLKSKLAQGTLHHSILIQGPSGCGKTTIARILKNELECSDFDFIEINAGNNRGIETGREIIRNVKLRPMKGNCRIYLLDEIHQATKDFQNALLKPLEDTPSYAYFILCTTDPRKLLLTIRNRCATYEVTSLNDNQIVELIEKTTKEENKSVDDEVVTDIMIAADGCPRQAMVILDQIIDMDPRRQRRAIKSYIGQEAATLELCQALLKGVSWKVIQAILKDLNEEPEKIRRAIIGYMASVAANDKGGGAKSSRAAFIFKCFEKPFYDTLKPGLIFSCWQATKEEDIHF